MDGRVKKLLRVARGTAASPWEEALQVFCSLLRSNEDRYQAGLLHTAVGECMRLCLLHRRASDALHVYEVLNRSGYTMERNSRRSRPFCVLPRQIDAKSLQGLTADELALLALHQQPYRAHRSMLVAELIAAECDSDVRESSMESSAGQCSSSASCYRGSVACTWGYSDRSETGARRPTGFGMTQLSEVEQFRIQLQQNIHLLRTTKRLEGRLGLQYLLSQMRQVTEDKQLGLNVEVEPLVQLSRAVLNHPLLFTTPSTELAREQLLFEDFGSFTAGDGLSKVQREKISSLEILTEPVRVLCKQPLKFMHCLAPSWDVLFVKRVAETLVLPEEAHNVLPRRNNCTSRPGFHTGSHVEQQHEENQLGMSRWVDSDNELFGGDSVDNAVERVEAIISRRLHRGIVVPDTSFVLQNFRQLLRLGKHREVVIPFSVLLDIVHSALDGQGSKRFHSRWVLLALMHSTTTKQTALQRNKVPDPFSIPAKKNQEGITLLGLQDEVALLEHCNERFFLAEDPPPEDLCEPCLPVSSSYKTSVLVTKQLGKLVPTSWDFLKGKKVSTQPSQLDLLVSGVVESMTEEELEAGNYRRPVRGKGDGCTINARSDRGAKGKPLPLFKSRSCPSWTRSPVVLATTNNATRRAAFLVGLSMYPPVTVM
uniref:PIN domain-containing protein n=1 Tax=Trypanosoma congolense (strain IL3000) TaxID=1068625 RepID=G0UUY3_TRYCI|nr:conserved hypothetical protein [Trypanosoma congolense IL3000]